MTNRGLSKIALFALDRLTDAFPSAVPRLFQTLFLSVLGNRPVHKLFVRSSRRLMTEQKGFDSILLVADMGIGDAIILQPAIAALRRHFPQATIDYVCNESAGDIVAGFPAINRVFPVFAANGRLLDRDQKMLRKIEALGKYSLVVNLCPFIEKGFWREGTLVLDLYVPFASFIVRSMALHSEHLHISTAIELFLDEFFQQFGPRVTRALASFNGPGYAPASLRRNVVFLPEGSIETARMFLDKHGMFSGSRILFYNPDTSSPYTRIPLTLQTEILNDLVRIDEIDAVLLGVGFSSRDIERELLAAVPAPWQRRVIVVPPQPLGVYAALIDACDLFFSGDGGPLHVAAAWKIPLSGDFRARNQTAVVSVFGATDSRMYGYDSERRGHIATSQQAPSKSFVSGAPCRNITCVNKIGKTCRQIRCFTGLDPKAMTTYVRSYFGSLTQHPLQVRTSSWHEHG